MPKIHQELVETISAVSMNNNIVRLFFANLDLDHLANQDQDTPSKTVNTLCASMPFAGFLYGATMIEKFLRDERIQSLIVQAKKSGAVPEALNLSLLIREEDLPKRADSKANTKIS
jgi:hypothetical protein